MLRGNRFRLITLGRLTLEGETGEGEGALAGRRSRLAVLAMLAMSSRPLSRDMLVGMFWGEQDEAKARHSLSNVLSSFRRVLGAESLATREADIALAPNAPLDVDARELADAIDRRDYARAVDLYRGPFLDGVVIDDSPGFDQWVTRERRRLGGLFVQACSHECSTLAAARRWEDCASLSARWLDVAPLSADAAIYLLNSIRAPGTRAALTRALDEYERLRARLAREFELSPEPPVTELANRIRERLEAAPSDPEPEAKPADVEPTTPAPAPAVPVRRSTLRWSVASAMAAVVLVLSFLHWGLPGLRAGSGARATTPVIAVLTMDLGTIDSASRWLADGLPQMIAGKLARSSAVEIVPAERARAALTRSGRTPGRLGDAQARDVASRVGATLVARGTLGTDGQKFVLDLTVHDVGGGDLVRSHVLSHASALVLADEAAVRILEAANVHVPGPQLAELETRSLEAYQRYLKALEALHAGRFAEAMRDIDAAIALDSGFLTAVRTRLGMSGLDEDTAIVKRLQETLSRNAGRISEFDRLYQEAIDAFLGGERERSDALARAFVRRYPRDPRAYNLAQRIIGGHGEVAEAQELAERALALDSLAIEAGPGPCAACIGYSSIVDLHWVQGNYGGALEWARRWVRAYPAGAPGWATLAWAYAYVQRGDSAVLLMQRAASLSGSDAWPNDQAAHLLLVARSYDMADSAIASLAKSPVLDRRVMAADLRVLLERERGRLRESMKAIDALVASSPAATGVGHMMRADNLRLRGEYGEAARMFEAIAHTPNERLTLPFPPGGARAFCWHHALAADALAPSGDTIRLTAIADTLERGCTASFYGRDWRLYHHVRGLVAMHGRRYAEAEREFRQAIWIAAEGWGRVVVELANAQLAQGRPHDAIASLRTAYATRMDAMGRYVPISELDYRMAKAFAQAGETDSARVYATFVRRAWRDADPEFKRLLADLPR